MPSAHYALQLAILERLKDFDPLKQAMGGDVRCYDEPPEVPQFPYITLGDGQEVPSKFDEIDASDLTIDIDIWDRKRGYKELKLNLVPAVKAALDEFEFATVEGHDLTDVILVSIEYLRDQDGLTRRAMLTFRANTEPD